MGQRGLGALIRMLGSNADSVKAYTESLNKNIAKIKLDAKLNDGDGALELTFTDTSTLMLFDSARSCCESRYMHTDDDLTALVGATFLGVDVLNGPTVDGDDEPTECMFVHVKTNKGVVVINTYNSHNGYYGGICITASGTPSCDGLELTL